MEWPPYSPDLNPMEYLWFIQKAAIYKRWPYLLTMQGNANVLAVFIEIAQQVWNETKVEVKNKLTITMVHRAKAVLKAESWYTKY
jgi:hypothetical protein